MLRELGGPLIFSDHDAFVDAFDKGSSLSPVYNSRIRRCCRAGLVALRFLPGSQMLADAYSRFEKTFLTDDDSTAAISIAAPYVGHSVGRPYRVVGQKATL